MNPFAGISQTKQKVLYLELCSDQGNFCLRARKVRKSRVACALLHSRTKQVISPFLHHFLTRRKSVGRQTTEQHKHVEELLESRPLSQSPGPLTFFQVSKTMQKELSFDLRKDAFPLQWDEPEIHTSASLYSKLSKNEFVLTYLIKHLNRKQRSLCTEEHC